MDALAALDVFAQTPSKDCRRGVADDSQENTTPQSRSGGRGRGRMSRGTAKVESDDDSGAGAAGSPGLQEVKNGEGDNACKACYGCGREPGSPDWFVPGEALKWAAMGKGHYCKDCHTLWRTLYASSLNLCHFGVWLKEATNQTTFNLEVIAYCSLVFEGVDCIRAARILERCNMIKFVFKLLGVPTGPFVVAEIGLDGLYGPGQLDPRLIVTMLSKNGCRLGVLVDSTSCTNNAALEDWTRSRIYRPSAPEVPTIGQNRKYLHTTSTDDIARLNSLFHLDLPLPLVADELASAAPALQTALRKRLEALQKLTQPLLERFADGNSWEVLKESGFTQLATKWDVLTTDANADGDQDVGESSGLWREAIVSGKLFVKLYREYLKSNRKQAKLVEAGVPLEKFVFLLRRKANIVPAARLELLMLQCFFSRRSRPTSTQPKRRQRRSRTSAMAWQR